MTNGGIPAQEVAADAIHRALSLYIGRGRQYQADDIEDATGIPARTVSSWIAASPEDRRMPPTDKLLQIAAFLGPRFTSKLLGVAGQGAYSLDPEPSDPAALIATLLDGTNEFTKRGLDHHYCHVDRGVLEPMADRMIALLQPFSSKGR